AMAPTVQSFFCLGHFECCLPASLKEKGAVRDYMITSQLAALVEGMCLPVFAPGRQSFCKVLSPFFHRFCSVWAASGDLASFLMRFYGHSTNQGKRRNRL